MSIFNLKAVAPEIVGDIDNKIVAYTDGSIQSQGKPACRTGRGVVLISGNHICTIASICGVGLQYTPNIAELMAIELVFERIKTPRPLKLYSDSEYSIGAIENDDWTLRHNVKLILRIRKKLAEYRRFAEVTIEHVYGHTGVYFNEVADNLAKRAAHFGEEFVTYSSLADFTPPEKIKRVSKRAA